MSWSLFRGLVLIGFLVPLTFIDLEHWVLPFELTVPGLTVGILSASLLGWSALRNSLLGASAGFLFFWGLEILVQWLLHKEGLGAGDKWLVALVGAFLGWQSLFGLVLLSNVQGAVVGSALLLLRGRAGPAPAPQTTALAPSPGLGTAILSDADAQLGKTVTLPADGASEEEDDWRPGPTHLPFGPWLALAAVELMLLGPLFEQFMPTALARVLTGGLAG